MLHFYIPQKRQKTSGFLTFLGGIEMEHWAKNGLKPILINPFHTIGHFLYPLEISENRGL